MLDTHPKRLYSKKRMETLRLPYPVPYYAQIASPELAGAIFDGVLPPEEDPRWAETGAETPQEYAYWVERGCGVACVKMCVEALGGPQRPLIDWARAGVNINGYLIARGPDGRFEERGWIHKALVALCQQAGLKAEACPADLEAITRHLRAGRMVIASVSYQIGTTDPVTKRGGHLVVITGAEVQGGVPNAFFINNPSGRETTMQANARILADRFAEGYTGRAIVVGE